MLRWDYQWLSLFRESHTHFRYSPRNEHLKEETRSVMNKNFLRTFYFYFELPSKPAEGQLVNSNFMKI